MIASLERRADPPEDPLEEDEMTDRIDVGLLIERARVARAEPLEVAADHLGVSLRTLQRWRAGEARPHRLTYRRIAAYLGCEVVDLLDG